ncbi:MAG: 3-phosphoshikimate 1-carboxyvinyltransferase [Chloroflexi bacterium]|nr:3-phosphoshikimate 1-carboxyvinyltransferase [Chloroflexota bacterium]
MNIISCTSQKLNGRRIVLPGDKSISLRAAIFSALADGESLVDNFPLSSATKVLLDSLNQLGIVFNFQNQSLTVVGCGLHGFQQPTRVLNCGNSATTMRLLAGAIASCGIPARLDGSPSLRARPMSRLVEPLRQMNVAIKAAKNNGAPLLLAGRSSLKALRAIQYSMPVASAQVKSAIMMAALVADGQTTIRERAPSRNHSELMLAQMGATVSSYYDSEQFITKISPISELKPLRLSVPGDISSAAFLIVATLVTPDSELSLEGVGINYSRTGLLDALLSMGANIVVKQTGEQYGEPVGNIFVRSSQLTSTRIGGKIIVRMIDEIPVFSVAAVFAKGKTVVENAEELHYKEADRITLLCNGLRSIGALVDETADGFVIGGSDGLEGGSVNSHGDHRLAMSFAVAGLATQNPVIVSRAECIRDSFPEFVHFMSALGAEMRFMEG